MNTLIDKTIECPNHEGSFDCNPFCRLCEGNQETSLTELLSQADSVAWEGCHKIYILMDSNQTNKMKEYGYKYVVSDTATAMENVVGEWYDDSCSLRFIDAVFTNDDETDKFITVVGQFENEEDDE